jgi:hypothetical protein
MIHADPLILNDPQTFSWTSRRNAIFHPSATQILIWLKWPK